MKLTTLIIAGLLIAVGTTFAQKGVEDGSKYGHGEDSVNCMKNSSLYYENLRNKNYKTAFPYWEKVFNECPLSMSRIYNDGVKIVKGLMEKEADETKKEEYFQYIMKIYDQRIKYYGNSRKYPESYIIGWKAMDIIRYKGNDAEAMMEAYQLFNKSIEGRGILSLEGVLNNHILNTIELYRKDKLTAEDVVEAYNKVSDVYEEKIKKSPEDEKLQGYIATMEKIVADSGVLTCEKMEDIFGAKYDENADNLAWLKRINRILSQQLCENDLTFKVAESIHKLEPSASSARGMAVKCLKSKDFDGAEKYYNEAITLEENSASKGSYFYELGMVFMAQNKYPEARDNFRKAIDTKPKWGLPYMQIGLIYAYSAPNCGDSEFAHQCSYWAVVDKFEQAKSADPSVTDEANKHIKTFSAYFPKVDDLFYEKLKEGDTYKVNCWINETTKVRAKK